MIRTKLVAISLVAALAGFGFLWSAQQAPVLGQQSPNAPAQMPVAETIELATPAPGTGATTVVLRDRPVGERVNVLIEYTDQFVRSTSGDAQFYLRRHSSWILEDEGLNRIPVEVDYKKTVEGARLRMSFVQPLGQFQITQDIQYGHEFSMRWTESTSWSTNMPRQRSGSLTLQSYSVDWDAPKPSN